MSRSPSDGDVLNNWQNALEPEFGEIELLRLRDIQPRRIEWLPGFAALVFSPHAPDSSPPQKPVAVVAPVDELAGSLRSALRELAPTEIDDLLAAVQQLVAETHRMGPHPHQPLTDTTGEVRDA